MAEKVETSGFITDFVTELTRVEGRLVSLAEAIPADKFSWRPSEEVRTLSEVYMHLVATNLLMPSTLGAAPPEGLEIPENPFQLLPALEASATRKKDVVAKLRESFEYASAAVRSIPASEYDTKIPLWGPPSSKRTYLLMILTHASEHLGQSIAYARGIGVVPPWSRPQESGGGNGR